MPKDILQVGPLLWGSITKRKRELIKLKAKIAELESEILKLKGEMFARSFLIGSVPLVVSKDTQKKAKYTLQSDLQVRRRTKPPAN